MSELLSWTADVPDLRDPVMVIALDGFVDAGSAGSSAAAFLRHRWRADVVATFDREVLVDYRARRPSVDVHAGRLRRIEWTDIELAVARPEELDHDLVFLLGPEPDFRWEAFTAATVEVAQRLGVRRAVTLGAYPAPVPHTRPIGVARAVNTAWGEEPVEIGDPVPAYTGPAGVATVAQAALADAGIPAMGLWAEVPHYIAGSSVPSASLALVEAAAQLLGAAVDTTELTAATRLHHEQVSAAVAESPDAAELVATLEEAVDTATDDEGELPSGEELADEIERFLRTEGP